MGPARSPRALGPHAGFRALACCSISALPGLSAATSPCRSPLSLLPPSLPPFLARSWPGRAPPRAAAVRTRASGKPLGRRGRSAHGARQVRGTLGAPAGNRGNPVRTPPVTSRVPRNPPSFLLRSSHTAPTQSAFPPGCPRTPSAFAPGSSGSPLFSTRIPQSPSPFPPRPPDAVSSQPGSLPGLLSLAPAWPWQAGGCSGAGTLDAQPIATWPGQALRAGTPGCLPLWAAPASSGPVPLAGLPAPA